MKANKNMSATKCKASYIGDHSIGIIDHCAISLEINIRFLVESI